MTFESDTSFNIFLVFLLPWSPYASRTYGAWPYPTAPWSRTRCSSHLSPQSARESGSNLTCILGSIMAWRSPICVRAGLLRLLLALGHHLEVAHIGRVYWGNISNCIHYNITSKTQTLKKNWIFLTFLSGMTYLSIWLWPPCRSPEYLAGSWKSSTKHHNKTIISKYP